MADNEKQLDRRGTVLVVDDEESIRDSLRMVLEYKNHKVVEASGGAEALRRVRETPIDAVLLDIKMPEMDGLEVLSHLREQGFDMPVVIITGHGDVPTAMEATRRGAFDLLEKPLEKERVLLVLRNALEKFWLAQEARYLRGEPPQLIGSSPVIQRLRETVDKAAPTPATVLITGESGTGKELVAQEIHRKSARRDRPLIQVNCAAIPEELIESELFGHEKGSFTGAVRKQVGKFVAADDGTIFLDEVGDMSARTQAKVLRVLQSGEVETVGSQKTIEVDVRVVAATNQDLETAINEGGFREDLFYRLNVIPIRTPPLREHQEDLPELVEYFVERYTTVNNYRPKTFSKGAIERLQDLPWKGNVRELNNVIERLLILSPEETISEGDVSGLLGGGRRDLGDVVAGAKTLKQFREAAERLFLIEQLERNGWNVTQTARAIETPRSNLYKKMESYDIRRQSAEGDD
jgi:two-component system nitrogen regulation response regulator NtrX